MRLRYGICLLGGWRGIGRAQERNNGLCQHFCLAESCHPSSCSDACVSIPPSISLFPFKLLLQHCSSEQLNLPKSMHGSFKKNHLGLYRPSISLTLNPHCFLQPAVMETSFPDTGTLGWKARCGAGTSRSSRETSAAEINCHARGWDQPSVSVPPTSLDVASSLTF